MVCYGRGKNPSCCCHIKPSYRNGLNYPLHLLHHQLDIIRYLSLSFCSFVCLFVCLFVRLSVCLFACLFVCLFVCLSVYGRFLSSFFISFISVCLLVSFFFFIFVVILSPGQHRSPIPCILVSSHALIMLLEGERRQSPSSS